MFNENEVKASVREEPRWKRVLSVAVDWAVVDREREALLEKYRKKLAIPGFRKGMVPREMARRMLGSDLDAETLQKVVPAAFEEALRRTGIEAVGDPDVADLHFHPGEPLTFSAAVEILPQVEIEGYKGLKVTREVPDIPEDMIDRTLDMIREGRATLQPVERPAAKGDVVTVRYVEMDEASRPKPGEPSEIQLELGSTRTPASFEEGLTGAAAGDEKTIALPYPADYPEPELAGTTRRFHVTVGKVEEKLWATLDDALARDVLGKEDATLDRLREQIRVNHEAEAQLHARRGLESRIVNRLLELNPFELPEGMVRRALDRVVHEAKHDKPDLAPEDEERMRESYRPMVERRYKLDLLLESVARREDIQVGAEDLDREIAAFAAREGRPAERIKAELRKENGLERLARDIFSRRVLERLVEHADVTEVTVPGQPPEENP